MTIADVCVTGGSGFLGLHIVAMLLEQGHSVTTTTRALTAVNPLHLLRAKYPPGRLTIIEADLLVAGAFDKALEGVGAVIHVATPVLLDESGQDEAALVRPAVEGTRNILTSCLKVDSLKTIIVTSSYGTVRTLGKAPDYVFTEKDFNPVDAPHNSLYFKSKILAEQEVWRFHSEHQGRFRVVTMHPAMIFGPDLFPESHRQNLAKSRLATFLSGEVASIPQRKFTSVDVRDVSLAHLRALNDQSATGRYIIAAENCGWQLIVEYLRETYPRLIKKLPNQSSQEKTSWVGTNFDAQRSKLELKLNYIPWKDSIKAMVDQLF